MEVILSNILLASSVIVCCFLMYLVIKTRNTKIESLIESKIKAHNESIYSIINSCEKIVNNCKEVNNASKDYVLKSESNIETYKQYIDKANETIELQKELIERLKKEK